MFSSGRVAQLVGASCPTPKGCGFNPGQGEYKRQLMDVSLPLLFLSLLSSL